MTPHSTSHASVPGGMPAGDAELLDRAAGTCECPDLSELSAEKLQELSERCGIELATAILYDRVRRSAVHGPLARAV